MASTAGAYLIKIGYDWVKRKWIDTPGKIEEDNVLTENNIKETNARKEAKEELLKTQSKIKIEEEAQLSDLRLRELEQKKRMEFEYAQKIAMLKNVHPITIMVRLNLPPIGNLLAVMTKCGQTQTFKRHR